MRSGTGLIQRRSKRQCERSFSSSKALPGNISRRTSSRRTCYTSVRAFPFLSSPTASVHKHSPRFLFSSLLILTAFSFSHVLLTARQIRVELSARRQRARRVTEGRGAGLEEEAAGSVAKQRSAWYCCTRSSIAVMVLRFRYDATQWHKHLVLLSRSIADQSLAVNKLEEMDW
eukprot:2588903-Rhodomonas_salina.2